MASRFFLPWLHMIMLFQCLGFFLLYFSSGSPMGQVLFFNFTFDGDGTLPFLIDQILIALVLAGAIFSFWKNHFWICGGISLVFFLETLCLSNLDSTFSSAYAVFTQAPRYLLPLSLGLWKRNEKLGMELLKMGICACFFFHGYQALRQDPTFIDYLITAAETFFNWNLPEAQARSALLAIGVMDMVLAGALLWTKSRAISLHMGFWGLLTSLERTVYGGYLGIPETLVRASHWGIPFLLFFSLASASPASEGPLTPIHKRIIWHENPAFEAVVSWTTKAPGKTHKVYYDTQPRSGNPKNYSFSLPAQKNGPYSEFAQDHYHHAFLSGLTPGTTYYFAVESDGHVSRELHFKTAAATGVQNFQLLFGGDSRTYRTNRKAMNDRMKILLEEKPDILALVHGGDYVHNGRNWGHWKMWLEDHELTTTKDGRLLPIVPTRGNHEKHERLFNHVFAWPGGGKNYYMVNFGMLLCFVLNTEISIAGDQKQWLGNLLTAKYTSAPWMVASYHRPAYPAAKFYPSGARRNWVPLFERFGMDLVFESDGHSLKQTVPIAGGRKDPRRGVVYVGEGGLGVKQRKPRLKFMWYLQSPGYATKGHHVQLLSVSPQKMAYQVFFMDGGKLSPLEFQRRDKKLLFPAGGPSKGP